MLNLSWKSPGIYLSNLRRNPDTPMTGAPGGHLVTWLGLLRRYCDLMHDTSELESIFKVTFDLKSVLLLLPTDVHIK